VLISVITVSWNAAASIDATCASVDAQTHPEVEHLVIDGQSTDGTLDVLARRPNPRRHVLSEPDQGLYDAMNKGLARAQGEIIVFLNADDRYSGPTVLAEVHRAFAQADADAVYADIDMVVHEDPPRVQRRWRSGPHAPWKVLMGWHMPHPGLFIHRRMLDRIGPFDTSYRIAADYDMMLRLMRQRGVRLQYLPLTAVEMAVGGISTSGLKASWRGYLESARALGQHAGVAGYVIALAKPIWKLPQWLRGRAANPSPPPPGPREGGR
jgi:glycosyltransferase involved in cell wall biosynthesis